MPLLEPLPELFAKSKLITLDFAQIAKGTPDNESIQKFFEVSFARGINPRAPENRQRFNNQLLALSNSRYLIGRYGENRQMLLAETPAGKQQRTIHLALDIFSKDLEPVLAPCDGEIVRSDYEKGAGEYGNYIILKPKLGDFYIFFGHLANDRLESSQEVSAGQVIARLGDYKNNENGGWSRHLHLQILKRLLAANETPIGYCSAADFNEALKLYPNPLEYFPEWQLQ